MQGAPGNRSFYENPEVDRLLLGGRSTMEPELRRQYFYEAQELIVAEAVWGFLFSGQNLIGISNDVAGFTPHTNSHHRFNNVSLNP